MKINMYYSQPATVSIIMERIEEFRIEWLNTDWQESNKTESQRLITTLRNE